jgi:hypothetical protein
VKGRKKKRKFKGSPNKKTRKEKLQWVQLGSP